MSNFTRDWFTPNVPVLSQYVFRDAETILEIGSFEGRSTCWFAEHCSQAHITCVDHFRGSSDMKDIDMTGLFERFMLNVAHLGHRLAVQVGNSWDVLPTMPKSSFDIVFVDGSHEAQDVLHDAVQAFRLVKTGGLIIFDDYGWGLEGQSRPKEAIDAFLHCFNLKVHVTYKGYIVIASKCLQY